MGHEYESPWAYQQSPDPAARIRAGEAFGKLIGLYHDLETTPSREAEIAATGRLNHALEAYYGFSVRAAAEGISEGERDGFIKQGLMEDGSIDPSDPAKADEQYRIISEGYELNRPYWDEKLGRMRRFRMDLQEMQREAEGDP